MICDMVYRIVVYNIIALIHAIGFRFSVTHGYRGSPIVDLWSSMIDYYLSLQRHHSPNRPGEEDSGEEAESETPNPGTLAGDGTDGLCQTNFMGKE